ncbi:bifunctional helix-turn-helix transcriptional regulator/GNAT family N-acetyltransferase [Autumnicola musiva]|uniref:Bifunctional helix-turn-helix transcriptional regulator/GNAT family N-acetyltransferase n=1 Tax=Autumnicola musiva TaxID=3075589 RepID=A0ABU3DB03_9FLAO|nr:bifunctional helix-turn-helix transcriptional regulator/GNAT family N-acetyltransferase [Zunongwangia sp. F117]MDT0678719.1 bifunctional helix-turn-helix transcriptional regulator/GNAT family N-acetyltransferase [Zunongwangia sp. F117]
MNTIEKAGILAIAAKLQNVLDTLRDAGNLFYKAHDINFETKWFPPIYVLSIVNQLSVTELAKEIGLSHPAAIGLLKEIEKNGLISSVKDSRDERKRNLMLSPKGREMVTELKPYWDSIASTLSDVTANPHNLFIALTEVETRLDEKPLLERLNEKAAHILEQSKDKEFAIERCDNSFALNLAKAIERELLSHQADEEINPNVKEGKPTYFLASVNGLPTGFIAIHITDYEIKIDSIAVLEQYRNQGVARRLIQHITQNSIQKNLIKATCKIHQKSFFEHLGFLLKKADNKHNRITMELKIV